MIICGINGSCDNWRSVALYEINVTAINITKESLY